MDRDEIITALTALGRRLDDRGLVGDMYVVGGAAIALEARMGDRLDPAARFFVEELFGSS